VWEQPLGGLVTADLRVQRFRGTPMLIWWEGLVRPGHGVGRYVVAASSYARSPTSTPATAAKATCTSSSSPTAAPHS